MTHVPMNIGGEELRTSEKTYMRPAHESLYDEIQERPDLLTNWRTKIKDERWIDAFEQHPLVVAASADERTRILPIGVYMDAAAMGKRESVLCCTIHFLHNDARH